MSDIVPSSRELSPENDGDSDSNGDSVKLSDFKGTQPAIKSLLENFEGFALKHPRSGIDVNALPPEQFNKVIELLHKNEDNALKYHSKKLETIEKIELGRQRTTTSDQRTKRITILATLTVGLLVTALIMFFKDQYLLNWFSFVGGLAGGFGISKALPPAKQEKPLIKPNKEDDDDDE